MDKTERYTILNYMTEKREGPICGYGTLRRARRYAKDNRLRCYAIIKGEGISCDIVYNICNQCICNCKYNGKNRRGE